MEYDKILVIARSQYNIIVQPIDAEAYDFPVKIIIQCRQLGWDAQLPVTLIDKNGDRCEFPVPTL
jgi:hypothetical protein